jgi:hypothetical protein
LARFRFKNSNTSTASKSSWRFPGKFHSSGMSQSYKIEHNVSALVSSIEKCRLVIHWYDTHFKTCKARHALQPFTRHETSLEHRVHGAVIIVEILPAARGLFPSVSGKIVSSANGFSGLSPAVSTREKNS